MELPIISDEQSNIVSLLKYNNVAVDAVAGSGKTTTILYIAKTYENKNVLLLTYNKRLRQETIQRSNNLDLKNIEIHTYHSYCYKYYSNKCITDSGIINVIKNNTETKNNNVYDILIIDEAQDMTLLYYKLIHKIYADTIVDSRICILGDHHQSIFQFNNADERYLIYADRLFNLNKHSWKKTTLKISYRLTNEMSELLNKCFL
jgi:superfamily I DNA/RNA helicase